MEQCGAKIPRPNPRLHAALLSDHSRFCEKREGKLFQSGRRLKPSSTDRAEATISLFCSTRTPGIPLPIVVNSFKSTLRPKHTMTRNAQEWMFRAIPDFGCANDETITTNENLLKVWPSGSPEGSCGQRSTSVAYISIYAAVPHGSRTGTEAADLSKRRKAKQLLATTDLMRGLRYVSLQKRSARKSRSEIR